MSGWLCKAEECKNMWIDIILVGFCIPKRVEKCRNVGNQTRKLANMTVEYQLAFFLAVGMLTGLNISDVEYCSLCTVI